MENLSELLSKFRSFIPFAESLRGMSGEQWNRPLQPGKWPVCGVIGHMMLWDEHFKDNAISPIAAGASLTLKHTDFDAFNAQAASYASSVGQNELIDACIVQRRQLVELLESLSPGQCEANYLDGDGNAFTIRAYLIDFIDHDRHHRLQIEALPNA